MDILFSPQVRRKLKGRRNFRFLENKPVEITNVTRSTGGRRERGRGRGRFNGFQLKLKSIKSDLVK